MTIMDEVGGSAQGFEDPALHQRFEFAADAEFPGIRQADVFGNRHQNRVPFTWGAYGIPVGVSLS